MAQFKFDGLRLRQGSTTVANVRRTEICRGTGSTTIVNVKGNDIRQGSGSRVLATVSGSSIRVQGSTVGTMRDVDEAIDGPGGIIKVALWVAFVR